MMSGNPVVVKVRTAPRAVAVIGLGWLVVSIFRSMLVRWTTRTLECPMSEIANAQIIIRPSAEPLDQNGVVDVGASC